ncbi:hypothetical protein ACWGI9_40710 [Streptomyces sp. NPDC054833]
MTPLRYPDGHVGHLVTGRQTARSMLTDARFSSLPAGKRSPVKVPRCELSTDALPAGMFVNTDPPEHTHYRRLPSRHFTIRRVRKLRSRIQEMTDRLLDEMANRGGPVDEVITMSLPAANRDPLGFEDPDTFNIRRGTTRNVGFGGDPHQCMGHHLARPVLAIGYESLPRHFPRLELAVPAKEIGTREMMVTYGVPELRVHW